MTGPFAFLLAGVLDVAIILVAVLRHRIGVRLGRAPRLWTVAVAAGLAFGTGGFGVLATPARADTNEPSFLMDDAAFIYSSPEQVEQNLRQIAALGVNVVKASVVWSLVAPDARSRRAPRFDATDPDAYPSGSWTRYDVLVRDARALGLEVCFQLTAPAPAWATTPGATGKEHDFSHGLDAGAFGKFVQAVARRYSGSWPEDGAAGTGATPPAPLGTVTEPTGLEAAPTPRTIPPVTIWGIWNEPNVIGWMSPQNVRSRHGLIRQAAITYRAMVDGAYRALMNHGHSQDVILIGETASGGETEPLPFIDELYCVDAAFEPLRGTAAALDGCPTSGDPTSFVAHNPGLFAATGWSHHPYSFDHSPSTPIRGEPYEITIALLGRLERTLDGIDATYGEPGGLPIYIDEWGYKTDPPNPYVHTDLAHQALWIDEGYYDTYEMPRVRSIAQEELYDQPPVAGKKPGSPAYWSNFDSGLEFQNGDPKPAYDAFRLPIWLPHPHAGAHVPVWAQIRPATQSGNPSAALQYRARADRTWTRLAEVTSSSSEGYLTTSVAIPGAGAVRLAWTDPASGETFYSRIVPVL